MARDDIAVPLPRKTGYTIYTKTKCKYCDNVKLLLREESPVLVLCDPFLEDEDTRTTFLEFMDKYTNDPTHRTFPFVFFNGIFVGGYDKTVEYHARTQLVSGVFANDDF